MFRRLGPVALVATALVLVACGRKDETTYDTAAGAVATPPPYTPPPAGMSVGATTGMTTGATTQPVDTATKRRPPG